MLLNESKGKQIIRVKEFTILGIMQAFIKFVLKVSVKDLIFCLSHSCVVTVNYLYQKNINSMCYDAPILIIIQDLSVIFINSSFYISVTLNLNPCNIFYIHLTFPSYTFITD